MTRSAKRAAWAFAAGCGCGLLVGVGMFLGAGWAGRGEIAFPEHALHAAATHGGDSVAIASGPIDDGMEGLFTLDFLTGELACTVVNPRTGTLGGLYRHSVVKDLPVEDGKQPKFLMVTAIANFRTGVAGNTRPAQSVLYVCDAHTGKWACYMLPWNREAANMNVVQAQPMVRLGVGSARGAALRN